MRNILPTVIYTKTLEERLYDEANPKTFCNELKEH